MALPEKAMRDAFLSSVLECMRSDPKVVLLAADFGSPVMDAIRKEHAARFVNVGIAEQDLINISTGMALEGFKVIAYAIAPFITMRCFEQVRVNLGILGQVRKMNVTLAGVGAGCSYAVSGPTHQCFEDLSIMRVIPGVSLFSPSDAATAAALVPFFLSQDGVRYIRMDAKPLVDVPAAPNADFMRDGCRIVNKGQGGCVIATGYMVHVALDACRILKTEGCEPPSVIEVLRLNPAPADALILSEIRNRGKMITLEEGFINAGGLDALVMQMLNNKGAGVARIINMGIKPAYSFDPGKRENLLCSHGIDAEALVKVLKGN